MPDISSTELGLKVMTESLPAGHAPVTMDQLLVQEVRQKLEANQGEKALENLKSPGLMLNEQKIFDIRDSVFSPDDIDPSATPLTINPYTNSNEQNARYNRSTLALEPLASLVDRSFTQTDPRHQNFLKTQLTNFLLMHQGFLAQTGRDPTNTTHQTDTAADAERMLNDPLFVQKLRGNIADALQSLKPADYEGLQKILTQQLEITFKMQMITQEIGNATQGLVHEIEVSRADFETHYHVERDPKTGEIVPAKTGDRAQDQLKAEEEKNSLTRSFKKLSSMHEYLGRILVGMRTTGSTNLPDTLEVFDPRTGGQIKLRGLPYGEMYDLVDAYEGKLEDIEASIKQQEQVIDMVNTEGKNLEKQIKEKEDLQRKKQVEQADLTKQREQLVLQAASARGEIAQKEEAFVLRFQSILGETATDLWKDAKDEAEKTKGEVTKSLEEKTYQRLYELLYGEIYNDTKKHFDKGKLKTMLEAMKNAPHGKAAENLGLERIQAAIVKFTTGLVAREDTELLPFLRELLADPAKRESICIRLTTDTLQLVALKNPKLFTEMFTDDELLIRKVSNDVLPGLISKVKENPTLKKQIETELNADLAKETKDGLMEKLARLGKSKLIKLLLAILGAAALIVGKTLLMP